MSYVNIPPAYYALYQPGTPYHFGGKGWLKAKVPGWGENPNLSWADKQAVNGLGADAPPAGPVPPFSYVGQRPFASFYRTGNAPWGNSAFGPAYGAPRPLACKGCVGTPIRPGIGALGAPCGDCQVSDGDRCLPCPEGSDLPECSGCVNGARAPHWYDNPLAGPVAIGVLTAIGTGLVLALLKKETRLPVGE